MSEKRRDSKNRILRSGESQRKDGRYAYKYTDTFGKPQFVYAWKLAPTDKTPDGKRDDISLWEKEKEIQKDLDDEIDHIGGCSIDSIKMSDAKEWALRMREKGMAYKTISNDKRSLKAAFYVAIQDDYIRKNPFDFQLSEVLEDDTEPKVPLSPEQEDSVYQKYYDAVVILLETGLRISELCGLNDTVLEFDECVITVDHQLLKDTEIVCYIETPKTQSGIRQIIMSEDMYQVLRHVVAKRKGAKQIEIDGYSNFLFFNWDGSQL